MLPNLRQGREKTNKNMQGLQMMEVMVMFNVSMDLDVANGACGHIVDIVLDV